MKLRIFGLLVLLVFCFGFASAYAQEPKNQMYYVTYSIVEPSMADKYEANVKKLIQAFTKHNFRYPFSASSTTEFDYYYLFAIDNFAGMDDINKALAEVRERMGAEKYDALFREFGGKTKYDRSGFYTFRADLSYIPETPRVKPEEANFVFWINYFFKTDKMPEIEKVFKEWISFCKSIKMDTGFFSYVGGIGSESPVIACSLPDKSATEFFAHAAKREEMYAEKFSELWKKTFSLLRNYENKMGAPRPDLSYTPKTE